MPPAGMTLSPDPHLPRNNDGPCLCCLSATRVGVRLLGLISPNRRWLEALAERLSYLHAEARLRLPSGRRDFRRPDQPSMLDTAVRHRIRAGYPNNKPDRLADK